MERAADANNTSRKTTKNHKLKILTVNVNGFNNFNKRTKIFNFIKTNKTAITLLQETHSTNNRKTMAKGVVQNILMELRTHTSNCCTSNPLKGKLPR